MRMFILSIVLVLNALALGGQEKQNTSGREPDMFWQSQIHLTPFRLPLPGKKITYIDLDEDGDPDVLQATINGNIGIQWIDDDDDMKYGDIEGDMDSDCLMIDRNGDGFYGGDYDLMIDWGDEDGDGDADIQVIVDNSGYNARREKYNSHYMIFIDTDNDQVFNYIDWNKLNIEAWDHAGRCNFFPDYNGQSIFLKAHVATDKIEDLRYNWENPFLFYDYDKDGCTEMTIRLIDQSLPKKKKTVDGSKTTEGKSYPVRYSKMVSSCQISIDMDNDSRPGNELDFDMSLKVSGKGFDYSSQVHKYKSLRGLPESDKYFKDPRWRQLTELIYCDHDSAYDLVFNKGHWSQCQFVFDEDDDCQRWERVEFYDPRDPFKVGAKQGGIDHNTQADVSGDRGEWDSDFSGKGQLYISPLDGRLHLLGAELGYWRIDQFATYFQGWQGARTPSIEPGDLITIEPEKFATVKYTDTDENGFVDRIDYDLDGDTLFEKTVKLAELGIDDSAKIINTADLTYSDYQKIYASMADTMWDNALKSVEAAHKYGLNTQWYSFLKHPKTLREKYSHGYWLSFYIYRDLLSLFERNGDPVLVNQLQKSYYSSNWNLLLKYSHPKEKECSTRGGLANFFKKLNSPNEVRIAYLGGSITAQPGWRVKSRKWFLQQYPQAKIREINAAIGGTGSDLGVYRLKQDVLVHNPDLLFIEFAVNDSSTPPEQIYKSMEGIVRKTWKDDPETDICFVYTLKKNMLKELQAGKFPPAASAMEKLAAHYGIPSIHMGLETARLERLGRVIFTGSEPRTEEEKKALGGKIVFSRDGTHPHIDGGHQLYLEAIVRSMEKIRKTGTPPAPHALPTPFVADNWQDAKMISLSCANLSSGWEKLDPAKNSVAKKFQKRFSEIFKANEPGESISFKFKGTAVEIYDLLGPDGGQVVIYLDDELPRVVARFDKYCTKHRLGKLTVAQGLSDTVHTVKLEIHPDQPDKAKILQERNNTMDDPKRFNDTAWYVGSILLIGEIVEAGYQVDASGPYI